MKRLFLIPLAALFIAGCSSPRIIPLTDFVTHVDDGETIVLQDGGRLHLDLQSEANDGRTWYIEGGVPDVLSQLSEPNYKAFENDYGSGQTVTWEFRAMQPGNGELYLIYRKADGTDPLKTFHVYVQILPDRNLFKAKKGEDMPKPFKPKPRPKLLPDPEPEPEPEPKPAKKRAKAVEESSESSSGSLLQTTKKRKASPAFRKR